MQVPAIVNANDSPLLRVGIHLSCKFDRILIHCCDSSLLARVEFHYALLVPREASVHCSLECPLRVDDLDARLHHDLCALLQRITVRQDVWVQLR
jgi:hypothetical protein